MGRDRPTQAMLINTFPDTPTTAAYAAFDLETKTYIDGEILPERTILRMCSETIPGPDGEPMPKYPAAWWRQHATVKAWAYMIWTPDGFCIAETFDEFTEVIARQQIRRGWWYNAPFDMSVLDWDMLSREWTYTRKITGPCQYSELASDFGARYTITLALPWRKEYSTRRTTRRKWLTTFYDLKNLCPGGLAHNLSSYKVTDPLTGELIKKGAMDYQGVDPHAMTPEDLAYCLNDVKGLWYLIQAVGRGLEADYGLPIHKGKPAVLTASGLSKRVFLRDLYPESTRPTIEKGEPVLDKDGEPVVTWDYRKAVRRWKKEHPLELADDELYREEALLGGGLVMINPDYQGRRLDAKATGRVIHRYDANQHYPSIMSEMPLIVGRPQWSGIKTYKQARDLVGPDGVVLVEISELYATLKEDKIPCWRHPFRHEVLADIVVAPPMGKFLMFDFEFQELREWYTFSSVVVDRYIVYRTAPCPELRERIYKEYARKVEGKREGDEAKELRAKLVGNGLGGKFSQNPRHRVCTRRMCDDVVRFRPEEDPVSGKALVETDEAAIMHIVQGAYVTAMGRTKLRRKARELCTTSVRDQLLYGDTDSLHFFDVEYNGDDYILGEFKRENKTPIVDAVFLAPKCYYEKETRGVGMNTDEMISTKAIALHSKGIQIEAIARMMRQGMKPHDIYKEGRRVCSLSALNVQGGKALIPLAKYMARPGTAPDETFQ